MAYHHLAIATRDMKATHEFYTNAMGFELVRAEKAQTGPTAWAKHFFYRMEDDANFIAFWELHDVPGAESMETNLSKAAGIPDPTNHFAFQVADLVELEARKQSWLAADLEVMEIDHNWCYSIYTRDPSDNVVEFCTTTGSFDEQDRERALSALQSDDLDFSDPPAKVEFHKA